MSACSDACIVRQRCLTFCSSCTCTNVPADIHCDLRPLYLAASIEEDADHRNPIVSMLIMGCLVLCGASPSVAPFFFINNDMGPSAVSTAVVIAGSPFCILPQICTIEIAS